MTNKEALEMSARLLNDKAADLMQYWGATQDVKKLADSYKMGALYLFELASKQK